MLINNPIIKFYNSSIGKKIVMAVTGLMLIGFVVVHLLGNFQIFLGAEKFNAYAAFLKSIPGPLWAARIILLTAFILHFTTAFILSLNNKAARGGSYKNMATVQADFASRYMLESGVVIFIFIIIHLLHFTLGAIQPEFHDLDDGFMRDDVYRNVILGFSNGPYAYIYIVAMLFVGLHLKHAFWSMFQTIGVYSPALTPLLKKLSVFTAVAVAAGYISIPLSVIFGILK